MLTKISIEPYFKAVDYLPHVKLMETHGSIIELSVTKPNVLVGPNGSGKSAFLRTLSLLTLSNLTGVTSLSDRYVSFNTKLWDLDGKSYSKNWLFLEGLTFEGALNPTYYYRPGFIPNEERCLTTALMCGYEKEARKIEELTNKFSSGQAAKNMLSHLFELLYEPKERSSTHSTWRYPTQSDKFKFQRGYVGDTEGQALALVRHHELFETKHRLIIMDEPEQSLDAYQQALLWEHLRAVDCSETQLVIATHSAHPLLQADRFNLIETVPSYIQTARELLPIAKGAGT